MILFALTGGIGNAIFALSAIKYFSRVAPVGLVVECDYDARKLFERCDYVKKVFARNDTLPRPTRAFCCYGVPAVFKGLKFEFVGWPKGTVAYERPESDQILLSSVGGIPKVDVTDWCRGLSKEKSVDVALIPCGKPGAEWERKKWKGFHDLAQLLELAGKSVEAFGRTEEIEEAGLKTWWNGPRSLESLPDQLARCRVAVSNDCGPGHIASSIGVPTVMLFTATSPVKGRPVGPHRIVATGCERAPRGCQSTPRWTACLDQTCRDIRVADVMLAVQDMFHVEHFGGVI